MIKLNFKIIFLALLLFSDFVYSQSLNNSAKTEKHKFGILFYPLLSESLILKSEDQVQYLQQARLISLGFEWNQFSFLIENTSFETSDGNSSLNVKSKIEMNAMLTRYKFLNWKILNLYGAFGLGLHSETVTTRLLGEKYVDGSKAEAFTSIGFGAQVQYHYFSSELELRSTQAKYLDPTFTYGILLRIGLLYSF